MSTFRVQTLRAAALFICISSSAFADSASHAGSAERFLQLANADRLAVPVYAQVQQMFAQRFAEAQAPDTKKALLERYQAQANTALDKAIGWDKLKPDLVALYTSQFSETELNQLIDFMSRHSARRCSASCRSSMLARLSLPRSSWKARCRK